MNGTESQYIFGDVPKTSKLITVCCCLAMSVLYVASLYIWNNKHNRDHPATVKRRFLSVTVVMFLTPIFVYKFSSKELLDKLAFNDLLGLRWSGLLMAAAVPCLLTMNLFFGQLCVDFQNGTLKRFLDIEFWKTNFKNILWIRNQIMAPLSEEFVFRACMMPLTMQSFTPLTAVFIAPLFFGVAHIHHIVERLSTGMDLSTALITSLSQLTYTTLFGFYSAYLFARTGHFVAPFLVHAFCNQMGLPDLEDLCQQHLWKRVILILCYIIGFVTWIIVLPLATAPTLYHNNIFWP